ncbi:slowpoke-binding protein-like [Lineus longissimus]|uniref:slowpoke-binding protein-like n=1 Tax=Lineus longissimus TaxID=88925 RepID=UPI002B4E3372
MDNMDQGNAVIDYFNENIWLPIVIGCVGLLVLVLLIWVCCKVCGDGRNHRQYDYTALDQELGLSHKMDLERRMQRNAFRDSAIISGQFYMRSSGKYTFVEHLNEIGSRLNRSYFMVKSNRHKENVLLTLTPKSDKCPLEMSNSTKNTLTELFNILKHPYIFPLYDIDFTQGSDHVVFTMIFNRYGSLKDLIYKSRSEDEYQNKYGTKGKGLSLTEIKTFGLQILTGLMFLAEKGFPKFKQLHTGNIMVQNGVCRLTGLENTFLGFQSKLHPIIKKKIKRDKNAVDSVCFGHVMFEMAAGYELDVGHPQPIHLMDCHNNVIKVLNLIFEEDNYPTIKEIANHEFFNDTRLPELKAFNPAPVNFTTNMKALLKAAKSGKPTNRSKERRRSSLMRSNSELDTDRTKRGRKASEPGGDRSAKKKAPKLSSRSQSMSSDMAQSAPGAPVAPPPPPASAINDVPEVKIEKATGPRAALLGEIRDVRTVKTSLKHVKPSQKKDRSKPMLRRK